MVDDELRRRKGRVPAWWADAKLGIFVHWGPWSVPAFAPTDRSIVELLSSREPEPLASIPYAEWYENSLRFPASPVARFHHDRYGQRPYDAFAADFEEGLDGWDPDGWARDFAATGARYVVVVAKHHDGWCLWPTEVANPHRAGWFSRRDLVGELGEAVRGVGLRFGVYYSGGLDWTFDQTPIGSMIDGLLAMPKGRYGEYADAQVRELVDRYRPAVLWNDIGWPQPQRRLESLLGWYFHRVPDGVVNDRWMPPPPGRAALGWAPLRSGLDRALRISVRRAGLVPPRPRFYQHRTPEFTTFDHIPSEPWECVRGMDTGFGYNATTTDDHHLSRHDLIRSLAGIVATGGNLLLNVGPRGVDAQIPELQARRLEWLGTWMAECGAALWDTRPWIRPSDRTPEGCEVRYTAVGDRLWAIVWSDVPSAVSAPPSSISLALRPGPRTAVCGAGGAPVEWSAGDGVLRVTLPSGWDARPAVALALDHVTAG